MSRKKQVNQKITALYCRISLDDGGDNESMSISNQQGVNMNCTPFVRQYDILDNKWGALLCQKEYQTNVTRRNSSDW